MGIDVDVSLFEKGTLSCDELTLAEDALIAKLKELLTLAVKNRIPDQKFGILFSGGVDSTLLALLCKQLGGDFICYTSALEDESLSEAQDLAWSKEAAAALGFEHKVLKIDMKQTESYLKKIVPLLKDPNVVNVGVALAEYLACEAAASDGITVLFSGLGSEELFAGYERHEQADNVNEECIQGLLHMPERDLDRQIALTDALGVSFRLPFLDIALARFAMGIPGDHKIKDGQSKMILRKTALEMGLPLKFANRKKTAAQYGSKFDRALDKLAKRENTKKSDYLERYR